MIHKILLVEKRRPKAFEYAQSVFNAANHCLLQRVTSSKVKNILLGKLFTILKCRFSFFWARFMRP